VRAAAHRGRQAQERASVNSTRSRAEARTASHLAHPILGWQRTIGNRAVQRLLFQSPTTVQAKRTVSSPRDPYEQEADRVADQVVATPADHAVSDPPRTQRFSGQSNGQADEARASVDKALASPGRPLEPALRQDLEQRLGYDFSRVRVHSGAAAERSAQDVNAHAYTVGPDLVFGEAQYSPHTLTGQRLLAHELVHTLQQSTSAESAGVIQRQASLDIALRSPTVTAQVLGAELLDDFKLNSHTLTAEHQRRLLALAKRLTQLLREHQLGTVEIIGHTDATGDEALNDQLGQDRADAVAAFLRRAGVPAMALQAESAGEGALRVPTARPEPRNRRVEIRFLPELPTPSPPTPVETVRVPRPESLCTEHPEICDPITTKPEVMPSCRPTNCSAYGNSFDQQPTDLLLVLTRSFPPRTNAEAWFRELGGERRLALQQIFNRLCQYGVWCHVRLVLKIDAGEPPVLLADRIFDVPGLTPSLYFMSPAGNALREALMDTGRFCEAYGAGASQHPGQSTLREISGSDSLHVSIGPGDQVDAHIDKFSPVPEHPGSSFCSNAPSPAAVGHIGREVFPEKFRQLVHELTRWMAFGPFTIVRDILRTASAGVQGFPELPLTPTVPQPEPATRQDIVPPPVVSITWRGPRRKPAPPLVPAAAKRVSPDVGVLSTEVAERIRRALEEQVSPEALLPSQVRVQLTELRKAAEQAGPDEEAVLQRAREVAENQAAEYVDAHDVAFDLATRMEQARRKDVAWVKLDLPQHGGLDGSSRKAIVGEIRRIALILRNYLPDRAAGVNTVVVIFGTGNMAVREEVKLPGWVARQKGIFD
jgi:outer membrane protein OmpA-like peptidoglycan-associated protein